MTSSGRITALIFILFLAAPLIPGVVAAGSDSPPIPHLFNGTVTVGQNPAPVGAIVTAVVEGGGGSAVVYAGNGSLQGDRKDHYYVLAVSPESGSVIQEGGRITFYVNGAKARGYLVHGGTWVETVPFESFGFTGLNLQVGEIPHLLPVQGNNRNPTDPDNDGLFEDLNGNSRTDFDDVVVLFKNMGWIAQNEPVSCFDFNGNGRIDFDDVVGLFRNK